MILKDPITILYDHLDKKLGEPQDILKNIKNVEGIELDKRVAIPMPQEEKVLPVVQKEAEVPIKKNPEVEKVEESKKVEPTKTFSKAPETKQNGSTSKYNGY